LASCFLCVFFQAGDSEEERDSEESEDDDQQLDCDSEGECGADDDDDDLQNARTVFLTVDEVKHLHESLPRAHAFIISQLEKERIQQQKLLLQQKKKHMLSKKKKKSADTR